MSTNRRVNVELTGTSRGLEAALNRIDQGLGRTQSRVRQTNREMSLWERQIMAIGTTARYALAGQFVFGVTAAISRLGDFTNQLGRVASLAGTLNRGTGQYTGPSQGFLSGVGDSAILESNKVGVAVNDIQDYMTRFFSSFQVPPGQRMSEMRGFVDEVSQLAAMLGQEAGDPQTLAGGIASMVNQIPGGRRNIAGTTNRIANMISFMLAETPNVTGRDVANQIGRIGATQVQANMTPEQAFAVWGLASKAGGSQAVIARGVSQLLGSSLLHPQTPDQIKAYNSVGLPADANMLASRGGYDVLTYLLDRVGNRVKVKNPRALLDPDATDEDALAAAGITGVDRTLLYNLFGRQESVRQFIALLSQGGTKALKDYIKVQEAATKANAVRQREEAFQRENTLTRFNQQRQNLSLGLARGIQWPLEHIVAPPVGALSNAITEHRGATQAILGTAFGALAFSRGKRLLSAFRNRKAGGSPGQEMIANALAVESAPNVLAGGPTDGTRANPFWVIVHPDSWMVGTPGGSGGPFSGPVPPIAPVPGGGTLRKLARGVSKYGGPAALVTGSLLAAWELGQAGGHVVRPNSRDLAREGLKPENMTPDQLRAWNAGRWVKIPQPGEPFAQRLQPGQDLAEVFRQRLAIPPAMAELVGRNLTRELDKREFIPVVVEVKGDAKNDMTIRLVDSQGRTLVVEEKKGLPTKFQMAKPAPSYRGKSRATTKTGGGNLPPYMVP